MFAGCVRALLGVLWSCSSVVDAADAGGAVDHEIGTNNLQFLRFNAVTNKIEFSDTLDGGVD